MKPEHPHKGELFVLSGIIVLTASVVVAAMPVALPLVLGLVFLLLFALFAIS